MHPHERTLVIVILVIMIKSVSKLLTGVADACQTAMVRLVTAVQQSYGVLKRSCLFLRLTNVGVQLVAFTLKFLLLLCSLRSHRKCLSFRLIILNNYSRKHQLPI